jgi:hypothetical protein
MIVEGGPCPFFVLYPDICLTTEEKHGKLKERFYRILCCEEGGGCRRLNTKVRTFTTTRFSTAEITKML